MTSLSTSFIAILIAAAIFYAFNTYRQRYEKKLPPGPAGWPVIGNLLDMPVTHQWLKFAEWKDIWGMDRMLFKSGLY